MFKRTALIAVTVVAAVAPSAQARTAVDSHTPSAAQARVEIPSSTSRYAEMAAHREAIANRHWQQADNAPVLAITRRVGTGFDWLSAFAGALAALMLVLLVGLLTQPRMRPRRVSAIA